MNHVVRCGRCNEATPIRAAPPGKKYVRCPCHCLLICKASSSRIACPRENCRRVITLGPSGPVGTAIRAPAGTCRIQCVECQEIFMFNTLNNQSAHCPHCRTASSVGSRYKRTKASIYFLCLFIAVWICFGFTVSFSSNIISLTLFSDFSGSWCNSRSICGFGHYCLLYRRACLSCQIYLLSTYES